MSLFDTAGFLTRRQCGDWPTGLIWTHAVADLLIFAAYLALAGLCAWWALVRRERADMRAVTALFAAFIFSCGLTHGMDALTFLWPAYRLEALIKVVTAIVSCGTAAVFAALSPRLLRRPTALDLAAGQETLLAAYGSFQERLTTSATRLDSETETHLETARASLARLRAMTEETSRG